VALCSRQFARVPYAVASVMKAGGVGCAALDLVLDSHVLLLDPVVEELAGTHLLDSHSSLGCT
jgi:hypothetical protein